MAATVLIPVSSLLLDLITVKYRDVVILILFLVVVKSSGGLDAGD
jgi:hypothetical protein